MRVPLDDIVAIDGMSSVIQNHGFSVPMSYPLFLEALNGLERAEQEPRRIVLAQVAHVDVRREHHAESLDQRDVVLCVAFCGGRPGKKAGPLKCLPAGWRAAEGGNDIRYAVASAAHILRKIPLPLLFGASPVLLGQPLLDELGLDELFDIVAVDQLADEHQTQLL